MTYSDVRILHVSRVLRRVSERRRWSVVLDRLSGEQYSLTKEQIETRISRLQQS